MEEISTPVEAVVEDTSVAEPVETTTETSAETEPSIPEEETAETIQEEVAPEPQEEKLYAGKYKSIEDLEKGYKEAEKSFNKVAELEKRIKDFESKQPKMVTEQGTFNPEIKAKYEQNVDNQEFLAYVDLARSLDNDTRLEVENILADAQRVYNPKNKQAYLNKLAEAKNYFNSSIVEGIARNRMELEKKYDSEMSNYVNAERQKKADYFASEIQKEPELYALVDPKSEQHSPEVLGIVKAMFDAYQTVDIPQTMKAIETLKELGVKQYLAKQEFEKAKSNASIKTGEKITTTGTAVTAEDAQNNYTKYVNKYIKSGLSSAEAMAKVDAIIMKG